MAVVANGEQVVERDSGEERPVTYDQRLIPGLRILEPRGGRFRGLPVLVECRWTEGVVETPGRSCRRAAGTSRIPPSADGGLIRGIEWGRIGPPEQEVSSGWYSHGGHRDRVPAGV